MFKVAFLGLAAIGMAVFLIAGTLGDVTTAIESTRTIDNSETALACSTLALETSCDITLPIQHGYTDTRAMTVTETFPGSGDVTANSTLASDRVTLTISGLVQLTSYTFDVDHKIEDTAIDGLTRELLRSLPALWPLLLMAFVLIAANKAWG